MRHALYLEGIVSLSFDFRILSTEAKEFDIFQLKSAAIERCRNAFRLL
jgi:hypothetical protein